MTNGEIVESFVVPVHPHTVLAPEQNEGWNRLRQAYDDAAKIITDSGADLLIIYSTTWPSIIGHQLIFLMYCLSCLRRSSASFSLATLKRIR